MNQVELKIKGLSSTTFPTEGYALVLKEADGTRRLPVLIGAYEAHSIKVMMIRYHTSRPLTHDLFVSLSHRLGVPLKKVFIYQVLDGIYYSYLIFEKDGEEFQIDARTSDAVALAMRYHCPIYTTEEILNNEQLHEVGEDCFSVPANLVSMDMLKEALKKAIENEDYEHASQLRDEIKRRESRNDSTTK